MKEQMDEREIRYFGQEAAIALQNRAFIKACEEMSQDAIEALVSADPFDSPKVAIAQLRVKVVEELVNTLEIMAARAAEIEEEAEPMRSGLN